MQDTITIEEAVAKGHRFEFREGRIYSRRTGQRVIRDLRTGPGLSAIPFAASGVQSHKAARAAEEAQALAEALLRAAERGLQVGAEMSPGMSEDPTTRYSRRKRED